MGIVCYPIERNMRPDRRTVVDDPGGTISRLKQTTMSRNCTDQDAIPTSTCSNSCFMGIVTGKEGDMFVRPT